MNLKTVFYAFLCCSFLTNAVAEGVAENVIADVFSAPPFSLETLENIWYQPTMPSAAYTLPMSSMERITSDFGPRKRPSGGASTNHKGIDIGMLRDRPLYAQASGKIIRMTTLSEWNNAQKNCNNISTCTWDTYHCVDKSNKNVLCKQNTTSLATGVSTVVCYGNGISIAYFHLSKHPSGLRVGSQVNAGDIIGYSGNTGVGGEPHLHYQIAYTPDSPDDCAGWHKNTIDPLCPFNMTLLPFYYKIEGKRTAKGEFRLLDNNNLCYGWEHLDGENGEWRPKRNKQTPIAEIDLSAVEAKMPNEVDSLMTQSNPIVLSRNILPQADTGTYENTQGAWDNTKSKEAAKRLIQNLGY